MHASERRRLLDSQPLQYAASVPCVGEVIHRRAERFAGPQNVRLREWRMVRAALGEEIAAEQRARAGFEEEPAFPRVRKMWRVEPLDRVRAQREYLAVAQRASRPVGDVVDAPASPL